MTPHQVLLTTAGPLEIAAAKVNLGVTNSGSTTTRITSWQYSVGIR